MALLGMLVLLQVNGQFSWTNADAERLHHGDVGRQVRVRCLEERPRLRRPL